jgi:threonine dehydrogenase-like Zn-dependent dehydrogenase
MEFREEPDPTAGPMQVVVEIAASGICTFERRLFAGDTPWYPVAPGHEAAGTVIEVGAAVDGLPGSPGLGDRVTVDLLTRCGTCGPCRRGRSALCRMQQGRLLADGTISFGGFSDRVVVDAASVYEVGDAPMTHAAMGEPIACCVHSIRRGGLQPRDRVAIIGGGLMGRLHLALARLVGAGPIGVVDVADRRLDAASSAGADWVAPPESALEVGGRQDVVFVTAGSEVDLAVAMADLGGTVVLYAAFDKDIPAVVGADRSHREEVAIVGVYSQEPADWQEASAHIRSGVLADTLDALVSARFPFSELERALALVTTEPTYRVFVEPDRR